MITKRDHLIQAYNINPLLSLIEGEILYNRRIKSNPQSLKKKHNPFCLIIYLLKKEEVLRKKGNLTYTKNLVK